MQHGRGWSNLLTIKEFSRKMRVHYNTVRNWIKHGMPATKGERAVRIDEKEAMAWLKARQNKGE